MKSLHAIAWLTVFLCIAGMVFIAGLGLAERMPTFECVCLFTLLGITGWLSATLADATEEAMYD